MTQQRDLRADEAELRERRLDLLETIERLEVRARDGVVIGLSVFTLRAVLRPAKPILYPREYVRRRLRHRRGNANLTWGACVGPADDG